jgi:hypothetical protein
MVQQTPDALAALYEADETAWLELTADLIRAGRIAEIDHHTLAEYLTDMAKRDRREVYSRLVTLLIHQLKWEHQPGRRSGSWRATLREQRRELRQLLEGRTLRNHADAILADAYREARLQAADEIELAVGSFPSSNPWTLEQLLAEPESEPPVAGES